MTAINDYLIYCLFYDDASRVKAQALERLYPQSVRLLKVGQDLYYEGQAFRMLMERADEWKDKSYVGTIAYSFVEKCGVMFDLDKVVAHAAAQAVDVVAFLPTFTDMLQQANDCHPKFQELWHCLLCLGMGFAYGQAHDRNIRGFYCNYWMARPSWMLSWIAFYLRAQHILDTAGGEFKERLYSDANYSGKLPCAALTAISGRPYYTYHPFLMERLPCFFFHHHNASLLRLHRSTHPMLVCKR
jgi:hypothetical protein